MKRIALYLLLFMLTAGFLPWSVRAAEGAAAAGGLTILKTGVTGEPLEGAVFQIFRNVRDGELADSSIKKKMLKIGGENRIMTMETFWDSREMTGRRCAEAVTDEGGVAELYGLPYGTYYLVETHAPEGCNRITDPIRVTVHKYSHLTEKDNVRDDQGVIIDNTLHIINLRYVLPDTGNLEMVPVTAAGAGLVFSAASLILLNRRRWKP